MNLEGIWPAVPTPLTDDEDLDEAALRRLISFLVAAGVDGLWILGAGAEQPSLEARVREAVIATALEETNGQVPVIAGVGECGTARTLRQVERVAGLGVAGVHAMEPYYYKLTAAELVEHFLTLADATDVPLVIYLHPERWPTGALLPAALPATLGRLANHPQIVGVKDSARDFRDHQRLLYMLDDDDFHVLIGSGRLMLAHLCAGGRGGIHGDAGVAPQAYVELYARFRQGDLDAAADIQRRLGPLGDALGVHEAAPHKFALSVLGLCSPRMARPLRELDDAARKAVVDAMHVAEALPRRFLKDEPRATDSLGKP